MLVLVPLGYLWPFRPQRSGTVVGSPSRKMRGIFGPRYVYSCDIATILLGFLILGFRLLGQAIGPCSSLSRCPKGNINKGISHSCSKTRNEIIQYKADTRYTVVWHPCVYVVFWGPNIGTQIRGPNIGTQIRVDSGPFKA